MIKSTVLLHLVLFLVLGGCSPRTGYEIFRQMNYQECLKQSPRPAEDCQYSPDYDQYRQLQKARDTE